MKKQIVVLLIFILIFFAGCNNKETKNVTTHVEITEKSEGDCNNTENIVEGTNNSSTSHGEKEQKVTADEFMEYYSITEEEIPKEYVQSFLDEYDVTSDDMEDETVYSVLVAAYENGNTYGHDVNKIFKGPKSQDPLVHYIKRAEVIEFSFGMHYGSEKASSESMVINLKERKIYYTRGSEVDYTKYELSSELTTEDVESIRETLPTHIAEDKGQTDFGGYGNYTFRIKMVATDETTKYYEGNHGDEEYFPGFDKYWKGLYKTYFGEPYKYIRP